MRKEQIDPKIYPIIEKMNKKGLVTADSCASMGERRSYSGRVLGKRHGGWFYPYVSISYPESNQELLNELVEKCEKDRKYFQITRGFEVGNHDKQTSVMICFNKVKPHRNASLMPKRKEWLRRLEENVDGL